ncbi:unnamed protein product [Lactuca saligna]|uniref:Uncharacterized protein n=1 Tax=Lactuca saligna TaxID=75948 RepID=A0AA35YRP6_LACSI|nr:unnamed protein product [Lactuca saligna]
MIDRVSNDFTVTLYHSRFKTGRKVEIIIKEEGMEIYWNGVLGRRKKMGMFVWDERKRGRWVVRMDFIFRENWWISRSDDDDPRGGRNRWEVIIGGGYGIAGKNGGVGIHFHKSYLGLLIGRDVGGSEGFDRVATRNHLPWSVAEGGAGSFRL